eukprot:scaffold1393_cov343-Prasinococcus_capsulatus_cf.AAC.4
MSSTKLCTLWDALFATTFCSTRLSKTWSNSNNAVPRVRPWSALQPSSLFSVVAPMPLAGLLIILRRAALSL